MNLIVNPKLKKNIEKKVIRQTSKFIILRCLSIALLILAGIGISAFIIFSIILPNVFITNLQGNICKDYFSIFADSFLIFCLCLLFFLSFRMLLFNISSKDLREREKEVINITDDGLQYFFIANNRTFTGPIVKVLIKYKNIKSIKYEENTKKIVFIGNFTAQSYDKLDGSCDKITDLVNLQELIVYDYFEPSLYKKLKTSLLDNIIVEV